MEKNKSIKWRSIVGLLIIYLAMWFNWQWIWGVLFMFWVIPDMLSGVTYFIEPIEKRSDPVLYWVIIITWIIMSLYSFSVLFYPEWK